MAKMALLISPPVYDTQYWERWSLPHGLLKISTWLNNNGYRTELIDCLSPTQKRVPMKKRSIVTVGANDEKYPDSWRGKINSDEKIKYIFGKTVSELKNEFSTYSSMFHNSPEPDEIWITSIMSYWWESTRDVIAACIEYFPKAKIRVGGIYPTIAPNHAETKLGLRSPLVIEGNTLDLNNPQQMSKDLIVKGEVPDANDLDLDFHHYPLREERPDYTILTTSRGCPRDCEYCAAYILSGKKVRSRSVDDILGEIENKYEMGIRDFCFYEDNLLMARKNFREVLQGIIDRKKDLPGIELHSPEGLEIRLVDVETMTLMKGAGFNRVYLPLESMDYDSIARWGRDFYSLKDFERAVDACEKAGFARRNQGINVFVLFGLPGEHIQHVYDTAVYAASTVGSVIPMLFAPVPGTPLFDKFLDYYDEKEFDLQHLNGKLLPFLDYNKRANKNNYPVTYEDYYQLEAFMLRINQNVRMRNVRLNSESKMTSAFKQVFVNYKSVLGKDRIPVHVGNGNGPTEKDFITERHGGVAAS